MIGTIVFEENGFPVELGSPREIERAVANGRLRASTLVKSWSDDGTSHTTRAEDVAALRPFLGLPDPIVEEPVTDPGPSPSVSTAKPGQRAEIGSPFRHRTASSIALLDQAREPAADVPRRSMPGGFRQPGNFPGCAITPLLRYADFSGRSARFEFWAFQAAQAVGILLLAGSDHSTLLILALIALAIPNLAVTARRLHDQNRSGWFILCGLIPYVGWLIPLVMMLVEGTPGPNRFGPDPKRSA